MKHLISLLAIVGLMASVPILKAQSQGYEHAAVLIPDSSIERPGDVSVRAHTNHLINLAAKPSSSSGPSGESPSQISAVYAFTPVGSETIAIVDAYDYPTAENDLNVFSSQFHLPACTTANGCLKKVYASGTKPSANCGWSQEAALDIEWVHAMAPDAKIVLVEAASSSFANLFAAVDVATRQVNGKGLKGEVSMSWGGSEFSGESSYDKHFSGSASAGVVYFAASGDTGGKTIYPGVSPDVVSAGGTTINRNSSGAFVSETGWSGSGGGPSTYELIPLYQRNVKNASLTHRSAPDFSFDANPNSGVSVYDTTSCQGLSGWLVFGGTSVASPSLSGIVNTAHSFAPSSYSELTTIYTNRSNSSDFRDIVHGTAGSYSAGVGYDFVTGVGSNKGLNGK